MYKWIKNRMPEIEDLSNDLRKKFPYKYDGRTYFFPEHIGYNICKRVRKDFDFTCGVSGGEGKGKTTLGIQLSAYSDYKYMLKRNILFSPTNEEIQQKVIGLKKYSSLLFDEAIRVAYKYDWAKKRNKYLDKLYRIARKENKSTYLCMPDFTEFSTSWLNHRINFWIHVVYRGCAVMFHPDDDNIFTKNKDRWHFEDSKEIYEKMKRKAKGRLSLSHKLAIYSEMPNFVGILLFNPLKKEVEEEYLKLSEEARYKNINNENKDDVKREKLALCNLAIQLKKEGKTYTEIAEQTGYSLSGLRNLMKNTLKNYSDEDIKEEETEENREKDWTKEIFR